MKKIISKVLGFFGALLMVFSLAGCGVNQKAADKINEAAEVKEYITIAELVEDYGDPTWKLDLMLVGLYVWANDCETPEDIEAKWNAGEPVGALLVSVVGNNAVSATYDKDWTREEKENA